MAVCFTAGVIGGAAVVLFSQVLYYAHISPLLGIDAPVALAAPDIYRPLFWGGLWGIPFGLIMGSVRKKLFLWGFLYFLAPVLGLYLYFLPMRGLGYFGLAKGFSFAFYLLLVNAPYGIITALTACWLSGRDAPRSCTSRL